MSTAATTINDVPVNVVRGNHWQLILYLVLNMWPSLLGIPVLLGIALFSKRVKRHPTFISLCVAFLMNGMFSSILAYAGRTTGPEPSRMLCLLQASLLYGMPPLTSAAAFMLILQMFFTIRAACLGRPYNEENHLIRLRVMLISPYVLFFICALVTACIGAEYPLRVSRNRRFFYCSVQNSSLTNALSVVSTIILLAALGVMVWTMALLYKCVKTIRAINAVKGPNIDTSLAFRIITFGLYTIIATGISLLSLSAPSSPVPDLVIASGATLGIIIFGTQEDMLSVICFWKRPPAREVSEEYHVDLAYAFDHAANSDGGYGKPEAL